jgi:hypothetical protein
MLAQKWTDRLRGNILAASERNVRMPRTQIRLDPGGQSGVSNSFVQLKKMRMSAANANPDDLGRAFRREGADTVKRQEERSKMNREQLRAQFLLRLGGDAAQKSQGEMQLVRAEPAETGEARIQPNEHVRDRIRQIQTNEKALRSHRGGSSLVVARDRRGAQTSQPAGHPLLGLCLTAGFQFVPCDAGRSGQKSVDQFHDFAR